MYKIKYIMDIIYKYNVIIYIYKYVYINIYFRQCLF